MISALLKLALALVVAYAGVCALLWVMQDSLVYFQVGSPRADPRSTTTFESGGETLVVSTRPLHGPNALVYFGGNAEDVSHGLHELATAFPDHALFLLHYRGYGASTGKPSEEALHADALALFDRVYAEHPNVLVVGRSLGSGVAVRLASERPVERLILVTPYDSLVEVAAGHYPIFPVRLLMRDRFDSAALAPQIDVPTTIVAAEHDEVIPRRHTDRLHASFAPHVVSYVVLPGVGHNTISNGRAYLEALRAGL